MNKMMTLLASVMLLASACTGKQASEKTASGLEPANFRTEVDGKQTDLFVLENKNGMEVCITNFGGRIVSVMVPDKDGVMQFTHFIQANPALAVFLTIALGFSLADQLQWMPRSRVRGCIWINSVISVEGVPG